MLDRFERLIFDARAIILSLLLLLTAVSMWLALSLKFDANLEKQLPADQPYIHTVLDYKDKIAGLNSVQIVVEARNGDIWTPAFLKTLYDVTQDLIYLPGVSRESVTSLWTPNTQFYEATESAVEGRNLIPSSVLPDSLTPADVARIRTDAFKGGFRGRLFALDSKAAMIQISIQPIMPETGAKTDFIAIAAALESNIRQKFETGNITIRIIGFTKFIGDIASEANDVLQFFVLAFVLNALVLWYYSRSLALTGITLVCSAASIVWLLAIIRVFDLSLNPLGLIVPFLIYAIGVSHGVQQINLFLVATVRGHTPVEAAQRSFRRLLVPGFFSLITVMTAFIAVLLVPVPFVQDLAVIAIIGIALKLISNLLMLPLAASYVRFSEAGVARQKSLMESRQRFMAAFSRDARPGPALIVLVLSMVLGAAAIWQAQNARVGHLRPGAQELWASARYNVDSSAIVQSFDVDLDTFAIVTVAPVDACVDFKIMSLIERFGVEVRSVPGVKGVMSLPEGSRFVYSIFQEGNLKWRVLPKAPDVLALATSAISDTTGLRNSDCSLLPIAVFLTDHRDDTLRRVAAAAEAFVAANKMPGVTFRLATGNAGVLAAINDTVRKSQFEALGLVFGIVALLVFAAFRDWRAVLCCVGPIALSTVLGLALMSLLDIGVTVSTLPVLILAVGIGVDYGLYLYERIEHHLREGLAMDEAFILSMREEGAAVVYTALTLAIGVGSWAFSGLKFQADMGWLLAFLVLTNALGAVTALPAMAVILDKVLPRRR
ncbi:MAG: MMPL family transporter [Alphaproteobacteria bacterium]|nr:MMPL family transporter [Alphaproteobacteria bacterium]